jgi:hypothetical protein
MYRGLILVAVVVSLFGSGCGDEKIQQPSVTIPTPPPDLMKGAGGDTGVKVRK